MNKYNHCIVITDDIFNLNIKEEKSINSFTRFKIRELKPSQRNKLIKKWLTLSDKNIQNTNNFYQKEDYITDVIDSTLGKNIGNGIMPSYPFFILSTILTYDALAVPLDQEITSQGYCYQAFIYFYLSKQGVKNDEINIYINFLTESAFYYYQEKVAELPSDKFFGFIEKYTEKYNLPIETGLLLSNLSQILSVDSFNNYYFRYQYIYYYFVAKYLADHIDCGDVKTIVGLIISNLHVNENAYIAIFISHHTKNNTILDEILISALCLFDQYEPAKLSKEEVKFFDDKVNTIIKVSLPLTKDAPEKCRSENLEIKDKIEDSNNNGNDKEDIDPNNTLAIELRRSLKTVEVMGHIIKNRAGSLEKIKIEEIFEFAMNVLLKVITSFFKLIEKEGTQKEVIDFISERLFIHTELSNKKYTRQQLMDISKSIFWNNNFFVIYGLITKIINSVGSDKLYPIIDDVCNKVNTPASYIVLHGISMWYKKSIDVVSISKRMEMKDFSEIAKKVIRFMAIEFCSLHTVKYGDRQKISSLLNIHAKQIAKKIN